MSIYATIWSLRFPRHGDHYVGCEWIEVTAQGVPAHVGTPTLAFGYEDGDPYAEFLPPPIVPRLGEIAAKRQGRKQKGPWAVDPRAFNLNPAATYSPKSSFEL